MDTYIWGPPLWALLTTIVRIHDAEKGPFAIESIDELTMFRAYTLDLLNSLLYVLPCVYCRQSYRLFVKHSPPQRQKKFVEWLWSVHCKVNTKLERTQNITLEKYSKRLYVWSSFVDAFSLWDLLTIVVRNYPDDAEGDVEYHEKCYSYVTFFSALIVLLSYVPTLRSVGESLQTFDVTSCQSRSDAVYKFHRTKEEWFLSNGLDEQWTIHLYCEENFLHEHSKCNH